MGVGQSCMEIGKTFADNITDYYDECYIYYKIFWRSHKNLCIHYGFHDKGQGHDEDLVRMIEVLADKAQISSREKILDAGCGVGGSSISRRGDDHPDPPGWGGHLSARPHQAAERRPAHSDGVAGCGARVGANV